MDLEKIIELDKKYYMNTFGDRQKVCFKYGKGISLWDINDNEYIDFISGIAVNSLGHSHPNITKVIKEQAKKFIHCSNYYYIESQALLAEKLVTMTCADKVFFANSGAEANDGALKLARAYFKKQNKDNKYEILSLINSFHGRTLFTLTATGQEKFHKIATPLPPGFKYVPINDIEALKNSISSSTCAILLELVQGESGVNPLSEDYLKAVKEICAKNDLLLIFDEIQTGVGRTGKFMCYEHYGIEPDIFTLAKGLGSGFPIGAICAKDKVAKAFEPGDHGSTFGGNPFACSVALEVLNTLESENIIENVDTIGNYMFDKLTNLKEKFDIIAEIRGIGLLIGVEFKEDIAYEIKNKFFAKNYLVGSIGTKILRFAPPLIATKSDIDKILIVFYRILSELTISDK